MEFKRSIPLPLASAIIIAISALSGLSPLSAQDRPGRTSPLPPADIIKLLPPPPTPAGQWKVKESVAFNSYEDYWLRSEARRTYVQMSGDEVPLPTGAEISIRLLDTAKHSPLVRAYENFVVGSNAMGENKVIMSFPAMHRKIGDLDTVAILIGNRFELFLAGKNTPPGLVESWLVPTILSTIAAVPSPIIESIPRPYLQERIDEIESKNSFSTNATFVTLEEAQRIYDGVVEATKAEAEGRPLDIPKMDLSSPEAVERATREVR